MVIRDEKFKIEGGINLCSIEDDRYYSFKLTLELLSIDNPTVNPVTVHGTLKVNSEAIIQEESLSYQFSELPNGVRNQIRSKLRELINDHIRRSQLFAEVSDMNDLISYLLGKEKLLNLDHRVWEYADNFDRSLTKQPIRKLQFGNMARKFSNDKVSIKIYVDKVTLHHEAEGALSHEAPLKYGNSYSLEQKIMAAFAAWENYYD